MSSLESYLARPKARTLQGPVQPILSRYLIGAPKCMVGKIMVIKPLNDVQILIFKTIEFLDILRFPPMEGSQKLATKMGCHKLPKEPVHTAPR